MKYLDSFYEKEKTMDSDLEKMVELYKKTSNDESSREEEVDFKIRIARHCMREDVLMYLIKQAAKETKS